MYLLASHYDLGYKLYLFIFSLEFMNELLSLICFLIGTYHFECKLLGLYRSIKNKTMVVLFPYIFSVIGIEV